MNPEKNENGSKVSLEKAREYIKNYTEMEWPLPAIRTNSMLIKKEYIEQIIIQDRCSFVRFFMAKTTNDDQGQYTLVVVGADAAGNNIAEEGGQVQIYEELGLCPPNCDGGGSVL